jgi:hypothetical protein
VGVWVVPVTGIFALVGAVLLFRLAGRLSDMAPRSREHQVAASIVLLFFPPVFTALGVYGLIVLTTERARRAFALGRKALLGPPPIVVQRVAEVAPRPPSRLGPTAFHRLLLLGAVLWTLYVGLNALQWLDGARPWTPPANTVEVIETARNVTVVALFVCVAAVLHGWFRRRTHRGLGIAFLCLVLFAVSYSLVQSAIWRFSDQVHVAPLFGGPVHAPASFDLVPSSPRLELPR